MFHTGTSRNLRLSVESSLICEGFSVSTVQPGSNRNVMSVGPSKIFCRDDDSGLRRPLQTTEGRFIPRIRHATGPGWDLLSNGLQDHLLELQRRSQKFGWQTWYWDHDAMVRFVRIKLSAK